MTEQLEGQMSIFDLGIWSGKMYPEHCPQENPKEQTSKPSSRKSSKSSEKKLPLFLSLSTDGQKPDASVEWVTAEYPFPSHTEYTMLSFGESPREENESHLSQILMDSVPEKYSLSEKACLGILNRAAKKGKDLPEVLKQALENQICRGDISDSQN